MMVMMRSTAVATSRSSVPVSAACAWAAMMAFNPAESQNVVPLMSMIKIAVPGVAAALDQAIGVEAHQGARADLYVGHGPLRPGYRADQQAGRDVGQFRGAPRACDDRGVVPGRADVHTVQARVEHRVQHGGQGAGL